MTPALDAARLGVASRSVRSMAIAMDTFVTVEVVTAETEPRVSAAIQRALDWFDVVERACSRFDPDSELRRLLQRVGRPVVTSPVLFEAVRFACELARRTDGAFDPTVGWALAAKGFDRDYRSGQRIPVPAAAAGVASFRDVRLDPGHRAISLRRPLVLDLGAVAKGLAIDLAARELAAFGSYCVEAGGDVFARGRNAEGRSWRIGIRDPRANGEIVRVLELVQGAVCTSGDYERRTADGHEHHLVDPRSGRSAGGLASATVMAPTALAADGLATAAFVLGPERGLRLLECEGVAGLLITPSGEIRTTTHQLGRTGACAP